MMQHLSLAALVLLTGLLAAGCSGKEDVQTRPDLLQLADKQLASGIRHYGNNDYAGAMMYFGKALQQYRLIDNPHGISNSYLNLAKSALAINRFDAATTWLQQAESVISREQAQALQPHLSLLQATLALKTGDAARAATLTQTLTQDKRPDIRLAALQLRTQAAFARKDDDQATWLQQYRDLQMATPGTPAHHARRLRFEAMQQENRQEKEKRLRQALAIYRKLARAPAIAATLTELAAASNDREAAIDYYQRALYIRHRLGDRHSSLLLLHRLRELYGDGDKAGIATGWIDKLEANDLHDWDEMMPALGMQAPGLSDTGH